MKRRLAALPVPPGRSSLCLSFFSFFPFCLEEKRGTINKKKEDGKDGGYTKGKHAWQQRETLTVSTSRKVPPRIQAGCLSSLIYQVAV